MLIDYERMSELGVKIEPRESVNIFSDSETDTCLNLNEFPQGIPFCRRFREIVENMVSLTQDEFMNDYKSIGFSKNTMKKWFLCSGCNPDNHKLHTGHKKTQEMLKYLCKSEGLNYDILFNKTERSENYINVESFITNLMIREINYSSPSDNYKKILRKNTMLKKMEQKILKDLVNTNKITFINNIKELTTNKNDKLKEYSNELIYKIAYYAFERLADKECLELLNTFDGDSVIWFKEYNQLKAKVFSKNGDDKKASDLLKELQLKEIKEHGETSHETINLLAASQKRDAIKNKDTLDDNSKNLLQESKEAYRAIYRINHNYYSAINIAYLEIVLNQNIENARKEVEEIWEVVNIKVEDWWSFITDIEIDILLGNYNKAIEKLSNIHNILSKDEISKFNVYSTIRQIKDFYLKFTTTLGQDDINKINSIIDILNTLEDNDDIAIELIDNKNFI